MPETVTQGDVALCPTCEGRGFLAYDVKVGHPRFGDIYPCSTCNPIPQQQKAPPSCPDPASEEKCRAWFLLPDRDPGPRPGPPPGWKEPYYWHDHGGYDCPPKSDTCPVEDCPFSGVAPETDWEWKWANEQDTHQAESWCFSHQDWEPIGSKYDIDYPVSATFRG